MERIVIIDHDEHKLYIEDLDEELVEKEYNGNEEDYIADNYYLPGHWSWDYITEMQYIPTNEDPIILEPNDLL